MIIWAWQGEMVRRKKLFEQPLQMLHGFDSLELERVS